MKKKKQKLKRGAKKASPAKDTVSLAHVTYWVHSRDSSLSSSADQPSLSHPSPHVQLALDTKATHTLSDNDFLRAFQAETLHIDFAHTI
eukprot:2690951-Rhodomonas_salina.2